MFKDNIYTLETSIKAVKTIIKNENLKDYVIFLGDSVGYGTPCPPDQTMSAYMNTIARSEKSTLRVFNLALPSSMFGDFYTVLLLLDKYHISTQNLILNFSYWEINAKTPTFWLTHYLKELDRDTYNVLLKRKQIQEESLWSNAKSEILHWTNDSISMIGYSSFINNKVKTVANRILKQPEAILQVWNQKKGLSLTMTLAENKWYYSDQAFDFSDNSPQLLFLDKIAAHQKGKNTLYFQNAMNYDLLNGATEKKGFQDNLKGIEKCFKERGLNYIDYNGQLKGEYFSDHIHLLPEGYKYMAKQLWNQLQ